MTTRRKKAIHSTEARKKTIVCYYSGNDLEGQIYIGSQKNGVYWCPLEHRRRLVLQAHGRFKFVELEVSPAAGEKCGLGVKACCPRLRLHAETRGLSTARGESTEQGYQYSRASFSFSIKEKEKEAPP